MDDFTWNLTKLFGKRPVPNAHQFAVEAKLSYPVAVRVLENAPMARVDGKTLGKLARYCRAKQPLALVRFTPKPDE